MKWSGLLPRIVYLLFGLLLIWKIQVGTKLTESSILYYFLLAAQAFPIGFVLAFVPHFMHQWNIPFQSVSRLIDFLTLIAGYLQWFHFFPWLSRSIDKWQESQSDESPKI